MKRNITVIQIINIIYSLILLFITKSEFTFLLTQEISILSSSIACLYSLFAIFILINSKSGGKLKWMFFVINIFIFLMHLYGIYFDMAIYNS